MDYLSLIRGDLLYKGVIYTTNRRVWEHDKRFLKRLKKTTAIGVDMETATVFSVGHYTSNNSL